MTNVTDKLCSARLIAVRRAKYFATGILSLTPVEHACADTIGVTKDGLLVYNPEYVENATAKELAGDWVHEWLHLMLGHHKRRGTRDGRTWNAACDLSIYDMVDGLGLDQIAGSLSPDRFDMAGGLTADEYYDLVAKDPLPGDMPRCGSGAGNPLEDEPRRSKATPGRSQAEIDRAARCCAQAVRDAEALSPGSVPGGLSMWADEKLGPPRVPWRRMLASAVSCASQWRPGAVRRTYRRPSRRQAALGWGVGCPIVSARYRPVPRVMLAFDTSYSMKWGDALRSGLSEAAGVLSGVGGGSVRFLACDCAVHEQREVSSVAELLASLKGGGGTSFVPVFDAVAKMRDRPELLVFVTDGGGEAPAEAPPWLRTIWLLVGEHRQRPSFGGGRPWGTFIEVEDHEQRQG